MKLAILNTPVGKYFYYHFLHLVKNNIQEAVLISEEEIKLFKEKGFFIMSENKNSADIYLYEFIKAETVYSFTTEDIEKFKRVANEFSKKC